MPRPISESVVVITGASSGIGRAVAEQLAWQRASLVLAVFQPSTHRAITGGWRKMEEEGSGGSLPKAALFGTVVSVCGFLLWAFTRSSLARGMVEQTGKALATHPSLRDGRRHVGLLGQTSGASRQTTRWK